MIRASVHGQRGNREELSMSMPRNTRNSGGVCSTKNRGTCAALSVLAIAIPVVGISYFAFGDTSPQRSDKTLIFVSVVFRHGDRTPTDTYPNDPFRDPSNWPEGKGALTKRGKINAYEFGEFLRRKYAGFLPELYSPDDIFTISSDHDRCLMSAELVMAGLYPPSGDQIWNDGLKWQPIPIHTTPRHLDQLIVVGKPCAKYDETLDEAKRKINYTEDEKQLFQYLSDNAGKHIDDIFGAELLYNTLEIEGQRGLTLPAWTKTVYPEPLRSLASRSLSYFTHTSALKRLKGGPLLKDIVKNMSEKVMKSQTFGRKFTVYSAHDLTIVTLLRTIGVSEKIKPDPLAALFVELHRAEDGSQHNVKVWYKNNTETKELQYIKLPNCPRPCSLKNFIENVQDVIPKDWDRECTS